MKKAITMKDIAKKVGVSQSAVSFTLSGKANEVGISSETQQRIFEIVQHTGYVPDTFAANVAGRKTRRIGIVVPHSVTENQNSILFALTRQIPLNGAIPLFYAVDNDSFVDAIRATVGSKVNDLVIIGSAIKFLYSHKELYSMLSMKRIYLVDFPFPQYDNISLSLLNVVKIGIDREQSYIDAVRTLADLGHKKIGITDHGWQFLHKFAHTKDFPEICYITCAACKGENYYDMGYQVLPEILQLMEEGVTAVMIGDDQVAIGLISALLDAGKKVPNDVSVIGFDNIDVAPHVKVPLASVDVPKQQMINILMTDLFGAASDKDEFILKGEIILRDSVGIAQRK